MYVRGRAIRLARVIFYKCVTRFYFVQLFNRMLAFCVNKNT